MRIVDVTQWYAPTSGGIRTYLNAKAAFAAVHGLDHAIIVPGQEPGVGEAADSPLVTIKGRTPTDRWGYRMVLRSRGVIAALEELRPSLVVLHDCFAFPAGVGHWARERGVPVAMVCHSDLTLAADALPHGLRGLGRTLLRIVQRRALTVPSAVLLPSQTTWRRIDDDLPSHARPVFHVPLGIDLDTFRAARPSQALREWLIPDEREAFLLYAGRLSLEKQVLDLVRMLAVVTRPARLIVAGTGPADARFIRLARRLGVGNRITLLGQISSREALAALMATADCFVHPNTSEAYGLAPLEALAAGCRVVAPSSAGCGENLRHRPGCVLIEPTGPQALAEGVERALELGRPGASAVEDLRWERTFVREWGVYRRLAAWAG